MVRVVVVVVIGFLLVGPLIRTEAVAAEREELGIVFAQRAGAPSRTETQPPGAAPVPTPADREGTKPPAAPVPAKPKSVPPFEPTEKVKADQAIDFPADI